MQIKRKKVNKMKKLKKTIKRTICILLTVAMLCTDTGVTAYAEDGAVQAEDGQTSEISEEIEKTEGDLAEEGEISPEETTVEGETADENSDEDNTETGATDENSAAEDGTADENPDVEDEENTGDAVAEESAQENNIEEDVEENQETVTKAYGDNIASGEYKENGNDITWVIDADGKLTVEGTGDFDNEVYSYVREPWYKDRMSIKSAEINVTGMTDASYMFYGCENLSILDVSGFDTSKVYDMSAFFLTVEV